MTDCRPKSTPQPTTPTNATAAVYGPKTPMTAPATTRTCHNLQTLRGLTPEEAHFIGTSLAGEWSGPVHVSSHPPHLRFIKLVLSFGGLTSETRMMLQGCDPTRWFQARPPARMHTPTPPISTPAAAASAAHTIPQAFCFGVGIEHTPVQTITTMHGAQHTSSDMNSIEAYPAHTAISSAEPLRHDSTTFYTVGLLNLYGGICEMFMHTPPKPAHSTTTAVLVPSMVGHFQGTMAAPSFAAETLHLRGGSFHMPTKTTLTRSQPGAYTPLNLIPGSIVPFFIRMSAANLIAPITRLEPLPLLPAAPVCRPTRRQQAAWNKRTNRAALSFPRQGQTMRSSKLRNGLPTEQSSASHIQPSTISKGPTTITQNSWKTLTGSLDGLEWTGSCIYYEQMNTFIGQPVIHIKISELVLAIELEPTQKPNIQQPDVLVHGSGKYHISPSAAEYVASREKKTLHAHKREQSGLHDEPAVQQTNDETSTAGVGSPWTVKLTGEAVQNLPQQAECTRFDVTLAFSSPINRTRSFAATMDLERAYLYGSCIPNGMTKTPGQFQTIPGSLSLAVLTGPSHKVETEGQAQLARTGSQHSTELVTTSPSHDHTAEGKAASTPSSYDTEREELLLEPGGFKGVAKHYHCRAYSLPRWIVSHPASNHPLAYKRHTQLDGSRLYPPRYQGGRKQNE